MSFEWNTERIQNDNVLKLWIGGEVTIYYASEFKEKLDSILKESWKSIELDLSKISKMDTSGLQILLALKKEAKSKNSTVRFVNHSHAVLKLIDLYGLTGFLRDKIKLQKEDLKEFSFLYGTGKN
ncbi:anti-sigma factor antagonist [Leptospira gomenensis]|uniref:Anti-sigma factor antagonist n=1 Tax=Leptospira gomenensis TaxID=2484974 RepID=A0A5F1YC65_9LEPT|nr:STAS domain-containing protein [Leptospira gomenensis]TGK35065.1 anti-sigma factor antagonist [Leptospira gomenensis]TGK35257.1 anti-sigma factor antagonist [Leptospira gomenensis]TGK51742.1 anti-sigma factor antagonist [Leptospira gomenensis]TGK67610.1 anti-sigma factor antagonist [Leptospira gomenensis]